MLKAVDHKWNDDILILNSLIKACRIINDKVKIRLPIDWKLLELILFELKRVLQGQNYLLKLYRALFAVGYYGMFRIGELTESNHLMKASNIHIGTNKNKILIILHSSKTHNKESLPQKVKILGAYGNKSTIPFHFCPFKLTRNFIAERGNYTDPVEQFFIFRDGSLVHPANV